MSTLFLIPSPLYPDNFTTIIGPGVLSVISNTQYYLVENVRTARRYISSLDLGIAIESLDINELNKETDPAMVPELMRPLHNGHDVGIISEAGCPGVADPGALAVDYAHRHGFKVVPLVGPSSFLLALMASGLSGQSFSFHGYLPVQSGELRKALQKMEQESIRSGATQIFMETPYRNQKMIETILQTCHPKTRICIAAGLTGPGELIQTMEVKDWKSNIPDIHKIPTVFLMNG